MKKIIAFLLAFCMLLSVGAFAVNFELSVYVDGQRVQFPDAKPFIDSNNRTLVPVRFVSEALNANVEWNGELRQVTVTKDSKKIVLTINKQEMQINGVTKTLDCAPLIVEDRTFVPIRFVSEALDAVVEWDGKVRTVYISTKKKEEEKKNTTEKTVDFNGFSVELEDGDVIKGTDSQPYVVTKSGLMIESDITDGLLLSYTYFKKANDNGTAAKNDVVSTIEQKFSDSNVKKIDEFLSSSMADSGNSESLTIVDGNYRIDIFSSRSTVIINVSDPASIDVD